jgi:hypothetical protein
MTDIRTKTSKSKKEAPQAKLTTTIKVEDIRIGDEIATLLRDGTFGEVVALKTKKVESVSECPSQWRTHVHINKMDCYDMRSQIRIVWK